MPGRQARTGRSGLEPHLKSREVTTAGQQSVLGQRGRVGAQRWVDRHPDTRFIIAQTARSCSLARSETRSSDRGRIFRMCRIPPIANAVIKVSGACTLSA